MADLRTDFVDDVLDTTQNLSRVYNIKNRDGSVVESDVIIEDVSVYTQQGSTFGASAMNETNQAVNELNNNLTAFEESNKRKHISSSTITASIGTEYKTLNTYVATKKGFYFVAFTVGCGTNSIIARLMKNGTMVQANAINGSSLGGYAQVSAIVYLDVNETVSLSARTSATYSSTIYNNIVYLGE